MKFGVREICDVVFKAKADVTIGSMKFKKGQPVLYIESAKTSTLEGAATTALEGSTVLSSGAVVE